jgi:hypothetical protein
MDVNRKLGDRQSEPVCKNTSNNASPGDQVEIVEQLHEYVVEQLKY